MLLEQAVSIGREHFGPLVAVVARGVAACEHMAERMHEAVVGGPGNHGDFAPDGVEHCLWRRPLAATVGVVRVVQEHVEERELELTHHGESALKVLSSDQA